MPGKFVASTEALQLNEKVEADNLSPKLPNQIDRGFCRASRR